MFLIDQNHVDFSVQQLYVLYKPAASLRARYKLIHTCQKKSKNISFPRYSKFPFLHDTAGKHKTSTRHKLLR